MLRRAALCGRLPCISVWRGGVGVVGAVTAATDRCAVCVGAPTPVPAARRLLSSLPVSMAVDEALRTLYPEIEARETGFLKVSDIHTVYYECSGNPDGKPVIFGTSGVALVFLFRCVVCVPCTACCVCVCVCVSVSLSLPLCVCDLCVVRASTCWSCACLTLHPPFRHSPRRTRGRHGPQMPPVFRPRKVQHHLVRRTRLWQVHAHLQLG